jgi:hypothetical protein
VILHEKALIEDVLLPLGVELHSDKLSVLFLSIYADLSFTSLTDELDEPQISILQGHRVLGRFNHFEMRAQIKLIFVTKDCDSLISD